MAKYIVISILLIFFSCNSNKGDESLFFPPSIVTGKAKILDGSLKDLATEIELIYLEYTNEESLVSSIRDIIVSDDYFFVVMDVNDMYLSKKILKFNSNGKFVKSINAIQTNDGEDSSILNIKSYSDSSLLIYDQFNSFLIVDHDFNLIKKERINFASSNFVVNDNLIYSYANIKAINFQPDSLMYDLIIMDENNEIVNKFGKFEIEPFSTINRTNLWGNMSPYNNGALFTMFLSDTIYFLNRNNIVPLFVVDLGKDSYKNKGNIEMLEGNIQSILASDFFWGISNSIICNNVLTFTYFEAKAAKGIVYFMDDNKVFKFDPLLFNQFEDVIPFPRTSHNGYFLEILKRILLRFIHQ